MPDHCLFQLPVIRSHIETKCRKIYIMNNYSVVTLENQNWSKIFYVKVTVMKFKMSKLTDLTIILKMKSILIIT